MRTLSAVLLSLLAAGPALALDPRTPVAQYVHDAWRVEQGLPQNSVQAILQDRQGYLWLGTQEGLARFDGVRFVVFDRANTAEIRHNSIQQLLEGRDGSLWIATYVGGLTRLHQGRFTAYGQREGLPDQQVLSLFEDAAGTLWVGTRSGLARFDGQGFSADGVGEALRRERVWTIAQDRSGALWIGTDGGLHRLHEGRVTTLASRDGLPPAAVHAVREDRDGTLWVGTYAGLARLENGRVTRVYTRRDGLANDLVWTLLEDRAGQLWIGTSNGVSRLANGRLESFTPQEGLLNGYVRALAEDREGALWIGTNGGGLERLKDGRFRSLTSRDGLPHTLARTILQDRSGTVWVGTNRGLAAVRGGSVTRYGRQQGFVDEPVFSMHQDREGALWAGTYGAGLWRKEGARFRSWHASDGLASNIVRAIHQDRAGDVWVGTEGGLNRLRGGGIETFTEKDGLPSRQVFAILEDRQGTLWFGTGGGLVRSRDGRFTALGAAEGLRSNVVFALHEDDSGVLWVGTDGGGLHFLQDGRLHGVGTRQGLFDDLVVRILDDGRGTLWMSSNRGVFTVPRQDVIDVVAGRRERVRSVGYGAADGMPSPECHGGSQPAGWRTTDGRLWFPTLEGVAVVDPARLRPNELPPPVVVEEVRVDRHPFDPAARGRVPPGPRDFEFHYTALSLLAPARVRFEYQLEGYDEGWVDAGARRVAYYSHLHPGRYRFRVRAANEDGVWNEGGAAVALEVAPRFWETGAFAAAVLGVMAVLVLGGHRLRTGHMRRRQQELEGLVERRTRDLREAQERAEASRARAEEASRAKTRFLANVSHELRTPLNAILGFVDVMQRGGGLATGQPEHLAIIQRSGEHLLALINDVLTIGQIEAGTMPVREAVFELPRLLQGLDEMFAVRAAAKGLRLTVARADGLPAWVRADDGKLRQILINLLGNAVKFTAAGSITLRVSWTEGRAQFEVEDTGPGIAEEEQERLFAPFVQGEAGVASEGTGLGLAISRTYAHLMGGELSVRSVPGQGATFRLSVPLAEAAPEPARPVPLGVVPLPARERPYRILVADDTLENRVLMARLHGLAGLEVKEALDGQEALDLWRTFQPDLIWMDTRMPRLDGPAATREIRRREQGTGAHVPIIAVTAGVLETEERALLEAGYDAVVPKPFRSETIFGLLRAHLAPTPEP